MSKLIFFVRDILKTHSLKKFGKNSARCSPYRTKTNWLNQTKPKFPCFPWRYIFCGPTVNKGVRDTLVQLYAESFHQVSVQGHMANCSRLMACGQNLWHLVKIYNDSSTFSTLTIELKVVPGKTHRLGIYQNKCPPVSVNRKIMIVIRVKTDDPYICIHDIFSWYINA